MVPRQKCRNCKAMILEITARTHSGRCGTCSRTRGWRNRWNQIKLFPASVGSLFLMLLRFPFILAYILCRRWIRHHRFPYDRAALKAATSTVHPPAISKSYYNGVIEGYWECAPVFCGFTQDLSFHHGCDDGGRLRRGEIEISSIPTHR